MKSRARRFLVALGVSSGLSMSVGLAGCDKAETPPPAPPASNPAGEPPKTAAPADKSGKVFGTPLGKGGPR